jgi:beta-lactamase class A
MTNKTLLTIAVFFIIGCASRKPTITTSAEAVSKPPGYSDTLLTGILRQYPELFDSVLQKNDQYHVQIIYTQIDRKADNRPVFTNYFYNLNPGQYFYPASTVKMPTAVLALQRLNELKIPGLDMNTTMITEVAYPGQTAVYNDPSTTDGRPTIAQYIRKIFLVSDNDAFNRLYEFLGQEYINNSLHKMGYDSAQIIHHLNISLSEDQNRHMNPVRFFDTTAGTIYSQPLMKSKLVYQQRNNFAGRGYYSGDQLINQPFDFSKKNRLPLVDLHSILESILFPEEVPAKQRFGLKPQDYQFLYRYMSMKPAESDFPSYDTSFTDAYSKLLLYGGRGELDSGMRIFNKEGDAYGFLTDIAYIVDFRNGVEFLLSATIACNSDGIFNDDHYDYDNVGYPFLKNLGHVIYQHELKRKRSNVPDLSKFAMNYGR